MPKRMRAGRDENLVGRLEVGAHVLAIGHVTPRRRPYDRQRRGAGQRGERFQ